jgi:hypothetical protein
MMNDCDSLPQTRDLLLTTMLNSLALSLYPKVQPLQNFQFQHLKHPIIQCFENLISLIIHKHRKWGFHIQNSDSNFILINSVILTGPPCNQRTIGHGFEESSTLYGLLYSHQNMCASVTIILKKIKLNCYFHFTLLSISTNTRYANKKQI